jgi:ArsR family transcriptional regulator
MLGFLDDWAGRFGEIEPRIAAILRRDYDLRAADRTTLTGSDLVERTTNGVRVVPEAGVRRVILAPSYFSRPYNFLLGGEGWRFVGYPVADAALDLDPLSPPAAVVRLHRALGDPTRLRILALLAQGELCVCHLTRALKISQPNVSRHLAVLRAAKVVEARRDGAWMLYRLAEQDDPASARQLEALAEGFRADAGVKREVRALLAWKGPACR